MEAVAFAHLHKSNKINKKRRSPHRPGSKLHGPRFGPRIVLIECAAVNPWSPPGSGSRPQPPGGHATPPCPRLRGGSWACVVLDPPPSIRCHHRGSRSRPPGGGAGPHAVLDLLPPPWISAMATGRRELGPMLSWIYKRRCGGRPRHVALPAPQRAHTMEGGHAMPPHPCRNKPEEAMSRS